MPRRRPVDILVDKLEMCHQFEFGGRLGATHPTLPLAELLIATSPLYSRYPSAAGQLHAGLAMMAEQITTLGTAALLLLRVHVEQVAAPAAEVTQVPVNP